VAQAQILPDVTFAKLAAAIEGKVEYVNQPLQALLQPLRIQARRDGLSKIVSKTILP